MTRLTKSLLAAALTLVAGSAFAGGEPGHEDLLCHNIGGPRDLGANCDGTGFCTYQLEGGGSITVAEDHFLGIVIGASENALAAHLAHGDGFVIGSIFDPPLHLASEIGPHRASNVDCLALREDTTQPPEPGN
jgi:hypothetical protein